MNKGKVKEIKRLQKELKEKNYTINSLNKKMMKKQTVIINDNLIIKNWKLEEEINSIKEEEVETKKRLKELQEANKDLEKESSGKDLEARVKDLEDKASRYRKERDHAEKKVKDL